jgi:predicted RND superfamily exporter protein
MHRLTALSLRHPWPTVAVTLLPAVVASLLTVGATAALTRAVLPILGWPPSEITSGAATVILVISCTDFVHLVVRCLEMRGRFADPATALVATGRWTTAPRLMTTATTAWHSLPWRAVACFPTNARTDGF